MAGAEQGASPGPASCGWLNLPRSGRQAAWYGTAAHLHPSNLRLHHHPPHHPTPPHLHLPPAPPPTHLWVVEERQPKVYCLERRSVLVGQQQELRVGWGGEGGEEGRAAEGSSGDTHKPVGAGTRPRAQHLPAPHSAAQRGVAPLTFSGLMSRWMMRLAWHCGHGWVGRSRVRRAAA